MFYSEFMCYFRPLGINRQYFDSICREGGNEMPITDSVANKQEKLNANLLNRIIFLSENL